MYFNIKYFTEKIRDYISLINSQDLAIENLKAYRNDSFGKFDTFLKINHYE